MRVISLLRKGQWRYFRIKAYIFAKAMAHKKVETEVKVKTKAKVFYFYFSFLTLNLPLFILHFSLLIPKFCHFATKNTVYLLLLDKNM